MEIGKKMEDLITSLSKDHKLTEVDRKICEYIRDHLDDIPYLSSHELGRLTYTSSAAVLRLSKKLGFKKYEEFKLKIALYLKERTLGELQINGQEDHLTTLNTLTEMEVNTIRKTAQHISMDELNAVVKELLNAKYIDIIANDANSNIAEYACHNFYMTGYISHVCDADDQQAYLSMMVDQEHVVFLLTKYGLNKRMFAAAKLLMERGIPVIGFLSDESMKLSPYCTHIFRCCENESFRKLGHLTYNISTKYLFDLLFTILFSHNYDETLKRVYQRRNMYGC